MLPVNRRSQTELQRTTPLEDLGEALALSLLRTTDLVGSTITRALHPYGVTMQQYNVLRILRGAGARGLPTLSIAERMIERTPGLTRLLDRIEQQHWVKRERCPKDRRVVHARITEAGQALLNEVDEPLREIARTVIPRFDESDLRTLLGLLALVRQEFARNDTCADPATPRVASLRVPKTQHEHLQE